MKINTVTTLLVVFDNCPGGVDRAYFRKSSRGGIDQKKAPTIATACGAQHTWDKSGRPSIQEFSKFSPKHDRKLSDIPLTERTFLNATKSDEFLFQNEVMGYLSERLHVTLSRGGDLSSSSSSHFDHNNNINNANQNNSSNVNKVVVCPHCDLQYELLPGKSKRICTDGCKGKINDAALTQLDANQAIIQASMKVEEGSSTWSLLADLVLNRR